MEEKKFDTEEGLFPRAIPKEGRFGRFTDGQVLHGKKKGHLPAMGWNSWNAFGSGNTEELTKAMADKMVELGLADLGYEYLVLDDGCYKPERVEGKLSNEEVKFPSGFRALSDHIHAKGLKFGMYNDIGTRLCAGAKVGTCGHEKEDAESYVEWGVDFLKVDNCYYPFDNATFSNPENARYTFAPNIRTVRIGEKIYPVTLLKNGAGTAQTGHPAENVTMYLTGEKASLQPEGYVTGIGTFDGTGPDRTPVGMQSSELVLELPRDIFSGVAHKTEEEVASAGDPGLNKDLPEIRLEYSTGKREGAGAWLQLALGEQVVFDDLLPETENEETFVWSDPLSLQGAPEDLLQTPAGTGAGQEGTPDREKVPGVLRLRIMNHRRQENTLNSYDRLFYEIQKLRPDGDLLYSACEWGKTQPQNWAYKVCDSWRILNDITFRVGNDGDPGYGAWDSDYTTSVLSQYNKAVIMDTFAGLDKGWNDPDMLMIGMDGLDMTMCETHFTMWCMMNSPLMLGLDLRRVQKGDEIYRIISNEDIIALSQDPLGVQAKRVWTSTGSAEPDKEYIRDDNRLDILAKPLADGSLAVSFINLSGQIRTEKAEIPFDRIVSMIGGKMKDPDAFIGSYAVKDLLSGNKWNQTEKKLSAPEIREHGSFTCRITPCL